MGGEDLGETVRGIERAVARYVVWRPSCEMLVQPSGARNFIRHSLKRKDIS